MKSRHGILLLIGSLVLRAADDIFGITQFSGFSMLYNLSSVMWTIGLIIILVKALSYPKFKDFMDQ